MRVSIILFLSLYIFQLSAKSMNEIEWYKGTVEQAFIDAKKLNRPIFLYWGALWCPPCNQIKKTIFTEIAFQKAMSGFIPVYLDGDESRAQIWSDKLQVKGYPTMLVMSPAGVELMRMPTGLNVSSYIDLLRSTASQLKPVGKILEDALKSKVDNDSWKILAGYSWEQDQELALSSDKKIQTFRRLFELVPADLVEERSKLFLLYLSAVISEERDLADTDKRLARIELNKILNNENLVVSNIEVLSTAALKIVKLLDPKVGVSQSDLVKLWEQAMEKVYSNDKLSLNDRLASLYPSINFFRLNDEKKIFDNSINSRVRERVMWASNNAIDRYSRQSVMSTAIWLLRETDQLSFAKKIALQEIKKSSSPFYFMTVLSRISKKQGRNKEALDWMAQGLKIAVGPATRFQWGIDYITGILEMTPDDHLLFEKVFSEVFQELLVQDDAFSGRNKMRLDSLSKAIATWNTKDSRSKFLQALKKRVSLHCQDKKSCLDLLNNL